MNNIFFPLEILPKYSLRSKTYFLVIVLPFWINITNYDYYYVIERLFHISFMNSWLLKWINILFRIYLRCKSCSLRHSSMNRLAKLLCWWLLIFHHCLSHLTYWILSWFIQIFRVHKFWLCHAHFQRFL
jgi:hypothetical protein